MRALVSSLLELAGMAAVSAGAYMLAPWAGMVVAGVSLALVGYALDPPPRKP